VRVVVKHQVRCKRNRNVKGVRHEEGQQACGGRPCFQKTEKEKFKALPSLHMLTSPHVESACLDLDYAERTLVSIPSRSASGSGAPSHFPYKNKQVRF
jgi:hypothetical protein